MALTKANNRMIDGAVVNVLDYGADPTGATDSTTVIQAAINTGKDVVFPKGKYLISAPLQTVAAGGPFDFPGEYAQKLMFDQVELEASASFSGSQMIYVDTPDAAIEGWLYLYAGGYVDYCIEVDSANATISRIRPYNYNVSGIFTGSNYGTTITQVYGNGGPGTTATVEANNTTGLILNNIQNFRDSGYLIKVTSCMGFVINGGTPDKSDLGVYAELSMGAINGLNLEGTRQPLEFNRSYVTIQGSRFTAVGGLALSPANSTDGVNLDIGDAASRKAGTSLIRGLSARVVVSGTSLTSEDVALGFHFTDLSGPNSNKILVFGNQFEFDDFTNSLAATTEIVPSGGAMFRSYEEGNGTGTVTGTTGDPATATHNYRYIKIGKQVTVWGNVSITDATGGSGSIVLSLPFTVNASFDFAPGGTVYNDGLTFSEYLTTEPRDNTATFHLKPNQSNTAAVSSLTYGSVGSGDGFRYICTYEATS